MTTDNFCFYLQNRLIQTSQTGGQWYSDTSPFSIPWLYHALHASCHAVYSICNSLFWYPHKLHAKNVYQINQWLIPQDFTHVTCNPRKISSTVLCMQAPVLCFYNALTYFATAVSYMHKMFMKLTPDQRASTCKSLNSSLPGRRWPTPRFSSSGLSGRPPRTCSCRSTEQRER